MIQRAEKKLLLEMVNRESNTTNVDPNPDLVARGLSAKELWEDIKFGCEAVFGNSSNEELPSEEDIAAITNRARMESDSVGKLTGGTRLTANSFDASKEFSQSHLFGGADFREIRKEHEKEERKKIPKNLKGIAHLWNDIKALENKKRERKSRICQIAGKGSGYGMAYVPVLAANNYTFGGESSVFDRELKQSNKSNFEVKKRKKGPPFDHVDYCVICGDGGDLVCCPRCPNTVHLSCVGLTNPKDFASCPHHQCSKCSKKRCAAGGVLFPCHACPHSFCEDCLPEEGVTFLGGLDRFDKLGFNSSKRNVYINCSKYCENYAKAEFGYVPPKPNLKQRGNFYPKAIDLSSHFGASKGICEPAAVVDTDEEATSGRGKRNVTRQNYSLGKISKTNTATVAAAPNPNHLLISTPEFSKPRQTLESKLRDTPSTATDLSSDTSSYCSVVDVIVPVTNSSGRDANHAIEID